MDGSEVHQFLRIKASLVCTRETASRTQKKAVFQSRAMLGRYCNGVGSKNSNDAPRARRDVSLNLVGGESKIMPLFAQFQRPATPNSRRHHLAPGETEKLYI